MRPRKDYDDYTTFVNDTYSDSKMKMFGMLSENNSREGSPKNATFNGANHLSIMRDMKKARLLNTASQTTRNKNALKVDFDAKSDKDGA